jgi:hypothetical protein
MACDILFGEFGSWTIMHSGFSDLLARARKNTKDNAVMDLLAFADSVGILNVFRYPESNLRREMINALRLAAQQWVAELYDEPDGRIELILRLIALTDAALGADCPVKP